MSYSFRMRILTSSLVLTSLIRLSFTFPFASRQYQRFRHVVLWKRADSTHLRPFHLYQEDGEDIGEKYEGNIDWDAEWKKVVQNKNQPTTRPGKDFYKSDTERAVIKVTRTAQEKIIDIQKQLPTVSDFDIRSLQGNSTFWFAVLAIISIGAALLAASGQTSSYANESFYI